LIGALIAWFVPEMREKRRPISQNLPRPSAEQPLPRSPFDFI
jgi:hypothetical protein